MIETILLIIAACITIYFAGRLVRKQNEYHEITKELKLEVADSLKGIEDNVTLLLNEDPTEYTLTYLELRMETLNNCLNQTPNPKYRRIKNVKRKKNFTDD